MPKIKRKRSSSSSSASVEGFFLLKILLYMLLGSLWVKFLSAGSVTFGLPVGLIIGLLFTRAERFRIDRKIEYAILLIAMLFGYFAPYGVYVNI